MPRAHAVAAKALQSDLLELLVENLSQTTVRAEPVEALPFSFRWLKRKDIPSTGSGRTDQMYHAILEPKTNAHSAADIIWRSSDVAGVLAPKEIGTE